MNAYDSNCTDCYDGDTRAVDGCGKHGTVREQVLGFMKDVVGDFLYYDRKEDEELPLGCIEEAVRAGELSADDIADAFKALLKKALS